MVQVVRPFARWLMSSGSAFALIVLLAACSFGSDGNSAASKPTPTSSTNLVTYQGDGFSIGYPGDWKVTKSATNITFTGPQGATKVLITVANNPNGLIPADKAVEGGLQVFKSQVKHYQKATIAATTTLAGDTWSQAAATGDLVPQGQTSAVSVKTVIIGDNHPANDPSTKAFVIAYATGSQIFDLVDSSYFQPMLQSLKFS